MKIFETFRMGNLQNLIHTAEQLSTHACWGFTGYSLVIGPVP